MPVSVIISAYNERENLSCLLPALGKQMHSEYEIIIVNDGSIDETKEFLRTASHNIRVFNLTENKGKKNALTIGIENARYENILLTDADCLPVSDNWISKVDKFLKDYDVLVGVSQYQNNGSILSELIQFDTLFTVMQMDVSTILINKPHMAVGRNLAFKKSIFQKVEGYKSHDDIPYGDDDLFINKLPRGAKIKLIPLFEMQTVSIPKTKFKDWIRQKRRHYSAGVHYNGFNFWYAFIFQQSWLWTSILWLGAIFISLDLFLVLFNYKLLIWGYLIYCKRKYKFKIRGILIPFYEVFYNFYFLVVGISVILAKKQEWN